MKYVLQNAQPGMSKIEQQVLEALNSGKIKLTTDKEEFTFLGVNIKKELTTNRSCNTAG